MAAVVGYLLFVVGAVAGAAKVRVGMAMLVGVVVVTSTLPWQLGLRNLAYPLLFGLGLLLGGLVGDVVATPPPAFGGLRRIARWTVVCIVVAAAVALARRHPIGSAAFALELRSLPVELTRFNPAGLAGFVQALMIPVAGVALFVSSLRWLADERARKTFERAFVAGATIAVASPLLQLLFLDPTVRPDKGTTASVGLVGFFQDPHSYGAYLVLAIGVVAGTAAASWESRVPAARRFAALGLVGGLGAALLFTGSRSALGSALVVATVFAGAALLAPAPDVDPARRRLRLRIAAGLVVFATLGTGLVTLSTNARGFAHTGLSRIGNPRTWEFLAPGGPERPLLGRRTLLWRKAGLLIARHPLFGVGPQGFQDTRIDPPTAALERLEEAFGVDEVRMTVVEYAEENAHNYYLQHAAEFGLPGLVTLLLLLAATARTILAALPRLAGARRLRLCGTLAGLAGFLTMSAATHPFLLAETQLVFWAVAAYGVCCAQAESNLEQASARRGPGRRRG